MLNQKQQKAINSPSSKIIIDASAGTGKTSTIIAAAEQHNFGSTILLTFTNRAADEMRSRISYRPEYLGTIHSFAYRELISLAKRMSFRVRILKEKTIKKIISMLFEENDFGVYVSSVMLNEAYNAVMYGSEEYSGRKKQIYKEIKKLYLQYKEQNHLYDLIDTPSYLLKKLEDHDMNLNYDLVLVDEAQDLDEVQYKLIQRLGRRTIVIGDPRQSIYMFRGATSDIFNQFEQDGYELHTLDINYRSKQEIVDNVGLNLVCERGSGGKIINSTDILKYGPQILCRTNNEVEKIKLHYPAVMTVHAAKGLEFNNVCVVDFNTDEEEDKNVMFVALTRAKDRVGVLKISQVLNYLFENEEKL